jgi:predicted small secreted protein
MKIVLMVIGLSSCETIKGLGKDIQNAGEAIEKSLKNNV